jgi:hypothetical protein
MSASNKKKLRNATQSDKLTERQVAAQKEAKKVKIYTTVFIAVTAILLAVALAVGVTQIIDKTGIRQKNSIAMTVGDEQITTPRMTYFFVDAVSNFYSTNADFISYMIDPATPLDQQMYSYDNIILKANQEQAKEQDKRYRRMAGLMPEGKDTLVKKPYDYWSSDANAKHRIYKSFCAFRRYTHGKIASWDQWKQAVGINWCYRDDTVRKDMEWLEHRRWNAYIRSIGFVYGKHTDKKLRVHSCLVESARIPIPGKQDRLDNAGDVKKYDVPEIICEENQAVMHTLLESLPTAEPEPAGV